MKRFRHLVIGGIQNKLFNLILITVLLMTAAFAAVSVYHTQMLTDLVAESAGQQEQAIRQTTDQVMGAVVDRSMGQSTELEAYIADDFFHSLEIRVEMLGEYAGKLFSEPDAYKRVMPSAPDAARNGEILAQLILAEGTDASDPGLADRIGLIGNLSDLMISLFKVSAETNSCFIALPDGVFLVTDDRTAAKFDEAGQRISYDPRTRPWYRQAVEKGELIFTDVEIDAFSGELAGVVGADLFLTSMRDAIQASADGDSYLFVVNQHGHVVFSPQTEGPFRVFEGSAAQDLRLSENAGLASLISDAMQGRTDMRSVTLPDGETYYMIGAPMKTLGWALVSVCSRASAAQPAAMMQEQINRIQGDAQAVYQEKTQKSRTTANILLFGIMALMLAGALILGKRIVKPLNTITTRLSGLSESNMEFRMEDVYRTGDEVQELAESFAAISHKTMEYLDTVKRVTAEKERIGAELSLATRIQASMLPHIFPPFPDRRDFDIYGSMDPAKDVGGDFYDYYLIDDDHLLLCIADVSGKGVPAALFMMASKIIIQSVAMLGRSPADILEKTNQAICSNNEAQMFVTTWVGILELSTGRLTAANAGHEYPAIRQAGGSFELYRDRHGFVIGGLEESRYREYEIRLTPGSRLFVYTDGVAEATNAENELFGTGRMLDALNENPDAHPELLIRNVRAAVDEFVKDAEQFDDLTMLCLEYRGSEK